MQFKDILKLVLDNEGGYANHPNDTGGETYAGITRRYEPEWRGWPIIDKIKLTRTLKQNEKIKEITLPMIEEIYRKNYWNAVKGDELLLIDDMVAAHVFDFAVNAGVKRAIKTLQDCVNRKCGNTQLVVDGDIGSKTLAAVKSSGLLSNMPLYQMYIKSRKEFYNSIAKGTQVVFLKSWLTRVDHITNNIPIK